MAATEARGTHASPIVFAGIAATSAALLMTEIALTRIFSVVMFYHFAFLAISIALFGLSASGVSVYVLRNWLAARPTRNLLCGGALFHGLATLVALAFLVHIRVGLVYTPDNARRLVLVYLFASLPFFTGGAVISLAFSRFADRVNVLYASDLLGAAAGCLALVPMLNLLGAPGAVIGAAGLSALAALSFAPASWRPRVLDAALALVAVPVLLQMTDLRPFDVGETKGHEHDEVLFSKWNSFSRVGVYDRAHADWSLSPKYRGPRPASLIMDIDSSASTPILKGAADLSQGTYLRYELTALAYRLVERPGGFKALVIGPGGGRDLLSALVFGARHVDGVEINPIIVNDVMRGKFRRYSGDVYDDPRVSIHIEDGRSFVRRSTEKFDVIQASLVDTWAATAAGAYTMTENSLYTAEAFGEYLDHLTPGGVLTVTRWLGDGLRLVSLAQAACARRGLDCASRIAVVRDKNVVTFMLKRSAFTAGEATRLAGVASDLGFTLLYAPDVPPTGTTQDPPQVRQAGISSADYRALIIAPDRAQFLARYPLDLSATTDDRPFYFHTTRLRDQFRAALGQQMLFGNGLSALLTLFGLSAALVLLFVIGPLVVSAERPGAGWGAWLGYFGALGAGFMLFEVAILQRFVLLLGHPVYSLTVTLFSLLLGTGLGSLIGRRIRPERVKAVTLRALLGVAAVGSLASLLLARVVDVAIPWPLAERIAFAVALVTPLGVLLGICLPGGMRLLHAARAQIVPWAWGINGALSVVGATLATFMAMNWGFSITLAGGSLAYVSAAILLAVALHRRA